MSTHPSITRKDIVRAAKSWIGTPYQHQASLRGVGCDCLGLVRGIWRDLYKAEPETPPPYSPDWAESIGAETMAQAALRHLAVVPDKVFLPGDVLLFRWRDHCVAKHAAIASSATMMIHAHDGAAVCDTSVAPWWRRRLAYVFRFPGVSD